jgi:hypothetical protein
LCVAHCRDPRCKTAAASQRVFGTVYFRTMSFDPIAETFSVEHL